MLHPDDLTPESMRAALAELLEFGEPAAPRDAYEGADTAAQLLSALADEPRARRHVPHRSGRAHTHSRERS
jgi:hypothetical protein